jgi:hypothetical protein
MPAVDIEEIANYGSHLKDVWQLSVG